MNSEKKVLIGVTGFSDDTFGFVFRVRSDQNADERISYTADVLAEGIKNFASIISESSDETQHLIAQRIVWEIASNLGMKS